MNFIDEISSDIDWRMSELATLKTIPLRYGMLIQHKNILIKYIIPSIYALWEGFVRNSFCIYTREINKLNVSINDTHINLLTHALTSIDKLDLSNPRVNFQKKREFIEHYQHTISNTLNLEQKIPTKSNVDFSVINDILNRFNLAKMPDTYERGLKKLLRFRNSIAHGENSIPVSIEDVTEFTLLVNNLMIEVLCKIEEGYNNNTFKK